MPRPETWRVSGMTKEETIAATMERAYRAGVIGRAEMFKIKIMLIAHNAYAPEKGPPAALHARHSSSFCALGSFLSAASRRRALRLSAQRST